MKRRFIVLVDFQDHSKWLISFAHKWARMAGAELLLMHQATDPVPGIGEAEMLQDMKQELAEKALDDLKNFSAGIVNYDAAVQYWAGATPIVSAVAKLSDRAITDYIFTGMNEKPAFQRLFMGDTAAKLSKDLDKIILAFPTISNDVSIDELYIGVKEKYPVNIAALNDIVAVKDGMIQHLHFFSVLAPHDNDSKINAGLAHLAESYGSRVKTSYSVFRDKDPAAAARNFMMKNNCVLVIQKGPRQLADLFRKFFTSEMISMARIPVIILPQ